MNSRTRDMHVPERESKSSSSKMSEQQDTYVKHSSSKLSQLQYQETESKVRSSSSKILRLGKPYGESRKSLSNKLSPDSPASRPEDSYNPRLSADSALAGWADQGTSKSVSPERERSRSASAHVQYESDRALEEATKLVFNQKPASASPDDNVLKFARDSAGTLKTKIHFLLGALAEREAESSLAAQLKAKCLCCSGLKVAAESKFPTTFCEEFLDAAEASAVRKRSSRIVIMGDFYPCDGEIAPTADFEIKSLMSGADLIIAGMACPVVAGDPRPKKFISVKDMSAGFLKQTMKNLDMDPRRTVFSVANTHASAGGKERFLQTLHHLRNLGCRVTGTAEGGPLFLKVRLRAVTLGICAWTKSSMTAKGLDIIRQELIETARMEQQKRSEDVHMLIGYPFWGREGMTKPKKNMTQQAHDMFQRKGFDLIFGHGPRAVLPLDIVDADPVDPEDAKDPSFMPRQALVAYSLGDALCPLSLDPMLRLAIFLEIVIADRRVIEYKVHPVVRDVDASTGKATLVPWNRTYDARIASLVEKRLFSLFSSLDAHPATAGAGSITTTASNILRQRSDAFNSTMYATSIHMPSVGSRS